jgi:four helix bundle protein
MTPAKKFQDLLVWQKAMELTVEIYRLTKSFPKEEAFGLTSQMRRAVISITSNVAEGFGRHGVREKDQFYAIARGSLYEVESQLYASQAIELCTETSKLLHRLRQANKAKGV